MKISIIGAGNVGSTIAFNLLSQGLVSEIALIDNNKNKVEGEGLDLNNGLFFSDSKKVIYGTNYNLTKNSNIIIITAGAKQKPGETRLELASRNIKILKEIIDKTEKANKKRKKKDETIYLIISNPVDVLTFFAKKWIKNSKKRVFGSGTILDTARIRYYISEKIGINTRNIHIYILGEHGDSSFPVFSSANISGALLNNYLTKKELEEAYIKTKKSAYNIINKKGATYYAIALSVTKIIKAIIDDEKLILPLSTIPEDYGIKDVSLSVPCIVGTKGVEKIFKIALNKNEKRLLEKSRLILRKIINENKHLT